MKRLDILLVIVFVCVGAACEKSLPQQSAVCSVNVVNAVVGGGSLKLNNMLVDSINKYNNKIWGLPSGDRTSIAIYPVRDSVNPYYVNFVALMNMHTYSLFLFGEPGKIESLLLDDTIPAFYLDSMLGVRLINLSSGNKPYSVCLSSDTSNMLFSNVIRKSVTGFRKVSLRNPIPYGATTFQIRGGDNGILASYSLPATPNTAIYPDISVRNARGRNITLVIRGSESSGGGQDNIGIFPVANY